MIGKIKITDNDTNENFIISDIISSDDAIKIAREKGYKNNLTIEIFINDREDSYVFTTFNVNKNDKVTCTVFPQIRKN
jgi:pyruvate carboxylase